MTTLESVILWPSDGWSPGADQLNDFDHQANFVILEDQMGFILNTVYNTAMKQLTACPVYTTFNTTSTIWTSLQ